MRIEWHITKKRGNLRPVLHYAAHLEEHEKALALPEVRIVSTIPKPEEDRQDYCYPDCLERAEGYRPREFHVLESPSHKGHSWTHDLRLPWRADNAYPEVETSFQRLRDAVEREMERANASRPLDVSGGVRTSIQAKAMLAPDLIAERFLRLAARSGTTGK
ncbi:MAG: hypothetical protein IJU37_03105 [Desulfovibrio sp.]|nr:hypothetical protein [Desulfovibrio sp.]